MDQNSNNSSSVPVANPTPDQNQTQATTTDIASVIPIPIPAPVAAGTSGSITLEYRDRVYKELAQATLDGLDTGRITVEQSKEIAQFVLERLDGVNTQVELNSFLQELINKWSVFQSVSLKLQEEGFKDEKIKEVQENINQINNQ